MIFYIYKVRGQTVSPCHPVTLSTLFTYYRNLYNFIIIILIHYISLVIRRKYTIYSVIRTEQVKQEKGAKAKRTRILFQVFYYDTNKIQWITFWCHSIFLRIIINKSNKFWDESGVKNEIHSSCGQSYTDRVENWWTGWHGDTVCPQIFEI